MKKEEKKQGRGLTKLDEKIAEIQARLTVSPAKIKPPKAPPETQLVLFPEAEELIRTELNTGKFANFIFISPRSKRVNELRTFQRGEGENKISLSITPATYETYGQRMVETIGPTITTSHYWYALLQIWEGRGQPIDGYFTTTGREIFKILSKQTGKAQYIQLYRELNILKKSSLDWKFLFVSDDKSTEQSGTKSTNFLSEFTYIDTKNRKTRDIFSSKIEIQIGRHIVRSMVHGNRKPVRLREYLGIASFDASRLYNMLDVFLSDFRKPQWKRNSAGLLEDLDIVGEKYTLKKKRRAKLKEFVSQLDGKSISTGKLKLSVIEGKQDVVFVAKRVPDKARRPIPEPSKNTSDEIEYLVNEIVRNVPGLRNTANHDGSVNLVTRYAMSYPKEVVEYALSVYRADALQDTRVRNQTAMFTVYLHREVHRQGLKWIGRCAGDTCSQQPDLVDQSRKIH